MKNQCLRPPTNPFPVRDDKNRRERDAAVANIAEVDGKHCFISLHILVTIIRNDNKKWTSTKIKRWKNTKNLLIRFTLQAMPRFRNVYSFLRSLLRGQRRVTTWRNLNKFNSFQFEYLIHYGWGGCTTNASLIEIFTIVKINISQFETKHDG